MEAAGPWFHEPPIVETIMPIYIAMLRGINVSGQKLIKMEQLRASFEALGFSDVKTYVQSGNVLFKTAKISETNLTAKIAKKILSDFGHSVSVLVRTPAELGEILKSPFAKKAGIDVGRLYVTFLSQPAPKSADDALKLLAAKTEQFFVSGREIHLHCPDGYGNTKFSNNAIEKKLSAQATTRNWRTVNALFEMAQS
jgi:uncharacterized protein (DUF1697 family)